jgi:hypothetical protein
MEVLNIGTLKQLSVHSKQLDRGGLLNWAKPIAPLIVSASRRGCQRIAEHLIGRSNFTRFDALVPGGLYALDSAEHEDMVGLAASVSGDLSCFDNDTLVRFSTTIPKPWATSTAAYS